MRILTMTLVLALVGACTIYFGDGDDTPPHHPSPDAGPIILDAVPYPDAAWSGYPDGAVVYPDASLVLPDASLIYPDASTYPVPDACGT